MPPDTYYVFNLTKTSRTQLKGASVEEASEVTGQILQRVIPPSPIGVSILY